MQLVYEHSSAMLLNLRLIDILCIMMCMWYFLFNLQIVALASSPLIRVAAQLAYLAKARETMKDQIHLQVCQGLGQLLSVVSVYTVNKWSRL